GVLEEHVLLFGGARRGLGCAGCGRAAVAPECRSAGRGGLLLGDATHLDEAADAVVAVDDEIAGGELEDEPRRRRPPRGRPPGAPGGGRLRAPRTPGEWGAASLHGAEELVVAEDGDPQVGQTETRGHLAGGDEQRPRHGR